MPPEITRPQFEAMVARTGLTCSPEQIDSLYAVWDAVEAMRANIRTPAMPAAAEPATTFRAEPACGGQGQ